MVARNRKLCPHCKRLFAFEHSSENFCSSLCERQSQGRSTRPSKRMIINCIVCRCKIATYDGKHCSEVCSTQNKIDKTYSKEQNKVKKSNEKWLQNKEKKKSKIPSYVLGIKIERSRVFNEKGLNHYYKRRKWDFV